MEENFKEDIVDNFSYNFIKDALFETENTSANKSNYEFEDKTTINTTDDYFKEVQLNELKLKNKFCFYNLTDNEFIKHSNSLSDDFYNFYLKIARTGVGLIFTGGFLAGENINLKNKIFKLIENKNLLIKLTRDVHVMGAKIFLTIKSSFGRGYDKRNFLSNFAKSASNFSTYGFYSRAKYSIRITDGKINEIIDEMAGYSKFADETNFDGILIDASLFSLAGELTSPEFNRRKFGYYSEISDFPKKLLSKIIAQNKLKNIFYEFSFKSFIDEIYSENLKSIKSLSKLKSSPSIKKILDFMAMLVRLGVDGFLFKFGTFETEFLNETTSFQSQTIFVEMIRGIAEYFEQNNIKNKFNNNVEFVFQDTSTNIKTLSKVITDEKIKFINITKQIYANENFLKDIRSSDPHRECIRCLECLNYSKVHDMVYCIINPGLKSYDNNSSNNQNNRRVIVVGGGTSGVCSAIFLAQRGITVELFEKTTNLNSNGRLSEIFGFDLPLKNFNDFLLSKIEEFSKEGKIVVHQNTTFTSDNKILEKNLPIIIATGYHENFLNISGAVLKSVKSISEALADKSLFDDLKYIIINSKTEQSIKLAIYLLSRGKCVSLVIEDYHFLFRLPNAKLTYYAYYLSKHNCKVFLEAKMGRIQTDFVEILTNNKLLKKSFISAIFDLKKYKKVPYEARLLSLDCDLFIYEPETTPNNKLYLELVKNGYAGEIFVVGEALKTSTLDDDIQTAYFVSKNI